MWRAGRDRLFAEHPDSPLEAPALAAFTGLPYAPYDPAYRFIARLDSEVEPARLDVPTGGDQVVSMDRVGRVKLGDLGSLDVWWLAQYGGGLFLPMRDTTAGRSTYGAGRYLLDTVKGSRPRVRRRTARRRRRPLARGRSEPRLPPVLRLQPPLGLPSRPTRQSAHRGRSGRRAVPRRRLAARLTRASHAEGPRRLRSAGTVSVNCAVRWSRAAIRRRGSGRC